MRHAAGVVFALALAVAALGSARATTMPEAPAPTTISDQLMLRLFGENTDARLSLAAAYGNREDESLLHGFVLRADRAQTVNAIADLADPFIVPRTPPNAYGAVQLAALSPVRRSLHATVHLASPTDAALGPNVDPFSSRQGGEQRSDVLTEDGAQRTLVSPSVRIGSVQVQGHVEGASSTAAQFSLQDASYGAGANFAIHAGRRTIDLDLASAYERLHRNDQSGFSSGVPPWPWQLPGQDAPFSVPSYADMNRLWIGATLGVPVREGLTLNLNYGAQHLFGAYGLPGVANLDSFANVYGGGLTFAMPHSSGTLSISATQYRYADALLPVSTSTQTNASVNFTVKF